MVIPLARACHFWPTVAVTAITTALAVAVGRGTGAIAVLLAVLAGQLSVGWSNDYLDRDRDRLAHRSDKPIAIGSIAAGAVGAAALMAAVVCVPLSFLSGWRAALVHLGAVGLAWGYNAGLKNTPVSVVPYALAFGALPAFVTLGLPGHPLPPTWVMLAAALLGAGSHFVNTLADLADDESVGIRGVPHRLGATGSLVVGAALMAGAALVLTIAPPGDPDPLGVAVGLVILAAVAGVVVAGMTGYEHLAWLLTLAIAGLSGALFLANGASIAS